MNHNMIRFLGWNWSKALTLQTSPQIRTGASELGQHLSFRIVMRPHSFPVKLRNQPIYALDLQGVSRRTHQLPELVNALVDIYAGLAHARPSGKAHLREIVPKGGLAGMEGASRFSYT